MSLYYNPVNYGINDVTIHGSSARIYYPSEDLDVRDVAILPGTYPLVVFAHGDRSGDSTLCPTDRTQDYKRWGAVLHLLARCGFVVVSPAVDDVIYSSEATADRLEQVIAWVRGSWTHRSVLFHPAPMYVDPDLVLAASGRDSDHQQAGRALHLGRGFGYDDAINLGWPTSLGLVGHSWGARAVAKVAARRHVRVTATASVSGTWDEQDSIDAFQGAGLPTFMLAGADDFITNSYLPGLWNGLAVPKHQALVQHAGHWDWFGRHGSIHPCDESQPTDACSVAWQACSEMLLAFETKYLLNNWWRPPYLLGSSGGRPPFMDWFTDEGPCALTIRWDDPTATSSQGQQGDVTLGNWTGPQFW